MSSQTVKFYKQTDKIYEQARTHANLKHGIPNSLTFLRLLALPLLIYSFSNQITIAVYGLFLFSIGTDFADGLIARKTATTSGFGSKLDSSVDFLFISSMYLFFIFEEIYSPFLLFPIFIMFVQFIFTNHCLKKTIYDPIGKYYGSLLYGGIGLTLLFQTQWMYSIVSLGIIVITIVAMMSRLVYLLKINRIS
jgi:phosphatidylglycerophosphate synthase